MDGSNGNGKFPASSQRKPAASKGQSTGSPYYSTSPAGRRVQSATQFREREAVERVGLRKQSEPTISMSPTVESKVLQHKSPVVKPKAVVSRGPSFGRLSSVSGSGGECPGFRKDLQERRLDEDVSSAFEMISHEMSFTEQSEALAMGANFHSESPLKSFEDEDEILSQSDNLYRDVVSLCNEMGLDSSGIKESTLRETLRNIKSRTRNELSFGSEEDLSSIPCPVWNELSVSSTPRMSALPQEPHPLSPLFTEIVKNLKELQDNESGGPNRPVSARSGRDWTERSFESRREFGGQESRDRAHSRHSSGESLPDETYSRLMSTIQHIEDEESKGSEVAASFAEFMRQKYAPSSSRSIPQSPNPPHSSSFETCSELSWARSPPGNQNSYSARKSPLRAPYRARPRSQTARFETKDSIPKLPPIGGPGSLQFGNTPRSRPVSREAHLEDLSGSGEPSYRSGSRTQRDARPSSACSASWESSDEKAKNLFSFLDEVEKSDRETLFTLKYDTSGGSPTSMRGSGGRCTNQIGRAGPDPNLSGSEYPAQTMDGLIRKGSVELARDVIMLERKVEESAHNINVLEDTLLSQRELNIRSIKSSERDLKKRLKLQEEEYELALSRHQAFVDQLIGEKRALQDKCEKVLRDSKESEQKYTEQIKSLQAKHMDELKRLRKLQENAERNRKQKWVGTKTQEIRELTVKGLEPEVQRIIQRHQQEMSEMRAWHADELREMEERYARKQTNQLQELREAFQREKEEACRRERDLVQKRFDSDVQRLAEDFELQKRRLFHESQDEKDRFAAEEVKMRDLMQENVRKAQIKGEVEVENVREECEVRVGTLERRHENELRSLKDVYEGERESWVLNFSKKHEQSLHERELALIQSLQAEKETEVRERERRLKEDFEKLRSEDTADHEARVKRMSEKFQSELSELEQSERELKTRFTQAKAEVLGKEEEIFGLKTTLGLKENQNADLSESNMKMLEERAHLTSVIRREFATQIEALEEECRGVKAAVSELKAKHKLELEKHEAELEKIRAEKDAEIERIGLRVKQALGRKEETIQELSKQLEKAAIRINHLEDLLDTQRKDFLSSMTHPAPTPKKK